MKYRLSLIAISLFIVLLFIAIVASIMLLKQFKAEKELENQEKINKLNMNWILVMQKYAEVLNGLERGSSAVTLAKDEVAKMILRDLEEASSLQKSQKEQGKQENGN